MTRMLVIRPVQDGPDEVEILNESSDLRTLQGLVGGYIEAVYPFNDDMEWWHAYCNEEGKMQHLLPNETASRLAHENGWPRGDWLVGPVVFLGPDLRRPGGEGDVPDELVKAALQIVGGP